MIASGLSFFSVLANYYLVKKQLGCQNQAPTNKNLTYVGHAGFIYETSGVKILIDPWFYPAFTTWLPNPDNRFMEDKIIKEANTFDYLYISHLHEDHFDKKFLLKFPNKNIRVIAANYGSKTLEAKYRKLGYNNILVLDNLQHSELKNGIKIQMIMNDTVNEDSGLYITDNTGFSVLHLNDCHAKFEHMPKKVDVLLSQFSGATWYPFSYEYEEKTKKELTKRAISQIKGFMMKVCEETNPRFYVPSAGPPVFLDKEMLYINSLHGTQESVFIQWENVAEEWRQKFPKSKDVQMRPGDMAVYSAQGEYKELVEFRDTSLNFNEERSFYVTKEQLPKYAERRSDAYDEYHKTAYEPVTPTELLTYFRKLRTKNFKLFNLNDFKKQWILETTNTGAATKSQGENRKFYVVFENKSVYCNLEQPADFVEQYYIYVEGQMLRALVDGEMNWEEAFLSVRCRLRRVPDVYDFQFMGLLRYGCNVSQTEMIAKTMTCSEMVEHPDLPGKKIQKYCPHEGEQMLKASVQNGVIECPRHKWRWNAETGECISGGNVCLKMETF